MYKYKITCLAGWGIKIIREIKANNQSTALTIFFGSLSKDIKLEQYSILIEFVEKIS